MSASLSSRRVAWATFALSLAGAGVSLYLTWYGITYPTGSCPLTGALSCSAVLSSPYSKSYGVPVASFGLAWFLVAAWLGYGLARNGIGARKLLAWSLTGLVGVVGLVYVELFVVGALCLYCTSAHVLSLSILACSASVWCQSRKR